MPWYPRAGSAGLTDGWTALDASRFAPSDWHEGLIEGVVVASARGCSSAGAEGRARSLPTSGGAVDGLEVES